MRKSFEEYNVHTEASERTLKPARLSNHLHMD